MNKRESQKIVITIFMVVIFASSNFIRFADSSYQSPINSEFKANDEVPGYLNWNCRELGTWQKTYSDPNDLVIYHYESTIFAYVICDSGGLLIIDVTTATKPRVIVQLLEDEEPIYAIHISGDFLFLGLHSKFIVLNLDIPYEPYIVNEYSILEDSYIFSINYNDNYLFLGTAYQGILIYDLSDFLNPILIYQFDKYIYQSTSKFQIKDDILYVVTSGFFHIINISNPIAPVVLTYIDLDGWGNSFDIQDNLLVITLYLEGFVIYDLTNITNPIKNGYYWDKDKFIVDVHISGDLLYFICNNYGLWIVNFTETFQLATVNEFKTNGQYFRSQLEGNYLYIVDVYLGLAIIDVSTPHNGIILSSTVTFGGSYTDIVVNHGAAFITGGRNGLTVLSTRNPNNIREAGTFVEDDSCYYESVCVKGDFAYVYDRIDTGLKAINVKRPDRMYLAFEETIYNNDITPGYTYGEIFVSDDKLFLTTRSYFEDNYLIIYDLTNPDQPSQLVNITLQSPCYSITVEDHYVFVPSFYGISIYDFQNTSNLLLVATIDGYANDIFIEDSILYCATDTGFVIYDVSIIDIPYEVVFFSTSSFNYHGCEEIFYMNDRVYVLDIDDGLLIVNIEDIQKLTLEGRFYETEDQYFIDHEYFGGNLLEVYVSNNIVFLACGSEGIKVVSLERFAIGFLVDHYAMTVGLGITVGLLVIFGAGFGVIKRIRRRRRG
ncbi:MAG: LVIVD repeat-containing protein [Candidatus Heimdallarchaeota archaeon]